MKPDAAAVTASLRRLTARDADSAPRDLLVGLRDVIDVCVEIFGVSGGGVVLTDATSGIHYVAASDHRAELLEHMEATTGQGPSTDAFVDDQVVATSDIATDDRWPDLTAALADEPGIRAVLGVPVKIGAIPVGALDVHQDHPHEWTAAEREALPRYGAVVGATLAAALAAQTAGEEAQHLQHALDYRVVIERAVGYLMARDAVDSVAAFDLLRRTARSNRAKIGRVAQYLLDTGRLPPTGEARAGA